MLNIISKLPKYVTLFVTNRCNGYCQHCFYKDNLNKKSIKELSIAEIKTISQKMPIFHYLAITGGEPFCRSDILEIINEFAKNNKLKKVNITTNGSFPQKVLKTITNLTQQYPRLKITVKFSVDNIFDKHDKIKGIRGCFDKILYTIKELKKIQAPNLKIATISTLSALNEKDIAETILFIDTEIKPDFASINWARNTKLTPANSRIYKKMTENILRNNKTNYLYYLYKKSIYKLVLKTVTKKLKKSIPCQAGRQTVTIYSSGKISPCEMLHDSFGNLRDQQYDFLKIWNSEKAQIIRKNIIQSKCVCTYECVLPFNLLFSLSGLSFFIKSIFKNS